MKEIVFYLGLGTLFTHELDAVFNHEWRVMPLVRVLPEDIGAMVFVAAHLPLFAGVMALVSGTTPRMRRNSRFGIGIFLVVHALLHTLFRSHPAYEFSSILSNSLIFGGAILGIVYLILEGIERQKNTLD